MLGLVPLGVDIRLMPQTINMTKVHGFSLSCLAGGALRIRQGCGGGAQTGSDGGKVLGALPFQSTIDVEVGADVVDKLLIDGRKWLVGKPYKTKGGVERLL